MEAYDDDCAPHHFQYFHDSCLVRSFEVPGAPLFKVIVLAGVLRFSNYCFQVPANRIGSYAFTAVQLKTMQEVITLTVSRCFPCSTWTRRSSGTIFWASL